MSNKLFTGLFNDEHAMKIMDAAASNEWGSIGNADELIFITKAGILKNYSCASHGGYVWLTTFTIPFCIPYLTNEDFKQKGLPEFYVYRFEEDCDWSKLSVLLDDKHWELVEKAWLSQVKGHNKSLKQYADESLLRWHEPWITLVRQNILGGHIAKLSKLFNQE